MTPGGKRSAASGARGFAFGHARSREQKKNPAGDATSNGVQGHLVCLPMRASYTHGPSPVSTGVQRRSHLLCKSSIMPKNQLVKGKRTGYTEMQQDSHYLTLRPRKRAKTAKARKRAERPRRGAGHRPTPLILTAKPCISLQKPANGPVAKSSRAARRSRAARPLTFYPCWPPPPGYQPTARAQRANGTAAPGRQGSWVPGPGQGHPAATTNSTGPTPGRGHRAGQRQRPGSAAAANSRIRCRAGRTGVAAPSAGPPRWPPGRGHL